MVLPHLLAQIRSMAECHESETSARHLRRDGLADWPASSTYIWSIHALYLHHMLPRRLIGEAPAARGRRRSWPGRPHRAARRHPGTMYGGYRPRGYHIVSPGSRLWYPYGNRKLYGSSYLSVAWPYQRYIEQV